VYVCICIMICSLSLSLSLSHTHTQAVMSFAKDAGKDKVEGVQPLQQVLALLTPCIRT
jgi:hypothetical protein